MKNKNDPDLITYLNDENAYADAFMSDTQNLQKKLHSEIDSRTPEIVYSPVEKWGPWLYYHYFPKHSRSSVLCRRRLSTERNGWVKKVVNYVRRIMGEEILVDWNEIRKQYASGYMLVETHCISPDHNFLAYTVDLTGREEYMLQVRDLRTMHNLPNINVKGVFSFAWAQNSTLFYTVSDENQRPYRVLVTNLGADSSIEVPLFTENDSRYAVNIKSTKDRRFIIVTSHSLTSSEVYTIDAANPHNEIQRLFKRTAGVHYFLEHCLGFFYILTCVPLGEVEESSATSFYLSRCRVEEVQSSSWQSIPGPRPDKVIIVKGMDIFNGHLVLSFEKDGCSHICSIAIPSDAIWKGSIAIDDLAPWHFPLPTNAFTITPGSNRDFTSSVYRVVVSSPVIPHVTVDYDMSKRIMSIVQQEEVLGVPSTTGSFYSSSDRTNDDVFTWLSESYACERKEVLSHDGVHIPLTILFSKIAHKGNQSPGILKGYGAYGIRLDKSWCAHHLSLLDRGWVVAFADVRGGGCENPCWHESGSNLNKLNSIHDFVSCGKYLVNEGYVHDAKLGAIGGSAGGRLVGAAVNMHPELFGAAVLNVPFLDVCNTLLDPSSRITNLCREELGNPQIKSDLDYILRYSPYDNIRQGGCYPPLLVTASFQDSRVGVWEAAKWVAKVRDDTCSNCSRSVILKTNMRAGHLGGCHLCEKVYEYAFLMKAMGISDE